MKKQLFDCPKIPLEVYGDLRTIKRMFFWLLTAVQLSMAAGVFITITNHDRISPIVLLCGMAFIFLAYSLVHIGQFEWAVIFLALTLISILTFIATFGMGIHNIGNMGYALILLVSSLIVQRKTLVFLTLVTLTCNAWLVFGEIYRFYTPRIFSESVPGDFFTAALIIVSTVIVVRALAERLFQNQCRIEKELKEQREIKTRLEEEIHQRLLAENQVWNLNSELEKRVQERTAQFEHARYQLETFSYSVSHDLRSPLRAVNGYAAMLLEEYRCDLPVEAIQKLESIKSNGISMGRLVDGLLEYLRIKDQTIPLKLIDPATIVRDIILTLGPEVQSRDIEFVIGDLPPFPGSPRLVKKVYITLIQNAVKFTRYCPQPRVEIGSQAHGEHLVYFVRDNGIGFDMRYYNKLFGVFQRLHRADEFDGLGINLAIVQRIVNAHGGDIWAKGEVNEGAAFFFTFEPLSKKS